MRLLHAAVTQGHGGAAFYLALLYRNGHVDDDDENDDEEEPNGKTACDVELSSSRHGFEVRRSMAQYRRLLRFAADECGDRDAMFCLADCFFHGSDGFDKAELPALKAPHWLTQEMETLAGGGGGASGGGAGGGKEGTHAKP